jgi:hypothetical protein
MYTFTVHCHDGQYTVRITADDEPQAWTMLTRAYVLRDVRRIELEFELRP